MQFSIHALDAQRQIVALQLEAASEAAARSSARGRGLDVFSIAPARAGLRVRRAGAFPTMLFSAELRSLLEAGLNLVEALLTLAEKEPHGERQVVLSGLVRALHRGEAFSQALGAFPRHFSPLYVATMKASERTGSLREALGRFIDYQEELERVRKKVVSACIYPAILVVVGSLVLAFLMLYVVPRFARVYEETAGTLPFFSRLLLGFGSFVGEHGWLIALCLVSGIAGAILALSRPAARAWLNARLWRLPALGSRLKTYQLARLYRSAGMLLRAGIPALRALEMAQDLLAAQLRSRLAEARRSIEQGRPMSAALGSAGLATPVAARMMAVGERSGDMGRMFSEIARFHEDQVARELDWFTRAFEPVLMAVLGLAIGMVVVLMYMPIFELAGSIR